MKRFNCSQCGQRVFFENLRCESCGSALGFVPTEDAMRSFAVDDAGVWTRLGPPGTAQRPCQNYVLESVCNWMVAVDDPSPFCTSCRTTHIIPALGHPDKRHAWLVLEQAKRRLFYTLHALKLPAPSKATDPQNGLWFDFLEDPSPQQHVLTGHDAGVITLNVAEADDEARERIRAEMHEPYRTLLGHFRHESGHYYWDRLINNTAWIDEYRRLFGDERADYPAALQQHYANPVADWKGQFISVYASSHPWEDWAECWAHYLHMVDGLDTAAAWGLTLAHATLGWPALQAQRVDPAAGSALQASLVEQWLPLTQFVNAMNRSLGSADNYPFVVPPPVVAKVDFIHRVIGAAARGEMPVNYAPQSMGSFDNDVIEDAADGDAAAVEPAEPPTPQPA